ncbi:hypothetical protein SNOG_06339 [Parastagonospora nodorum SN15]|uniref:Uncharacterized protein n=1 Tax=Phaeosphaeria nodorum (strain SN15 / ATCC MYA-4574 / FGSC 10173) TaxID=321614 RepID=Q0UPH5_PHANO|nr:hypothetical protein SNOG_06339 [Parastagonospora nodorum SN15]EAT86170.1 hypothetical protein SNOG_06339 [Parastagonospora nodorum SN15]
MGRLPGRILIPLPSLARETLDVDVTGESTLDVSPVTGEFTLDVSPVAVDELDGKVASEPGNSDISISAVDPIHEWIHSGCQKGLKPATGLTSSLSLVLDPFPTAKGVKHELFEPKILSY